MASISITDEAYISASLHQELVTTEGEFQNELPKSEGVL